MTERRITDGGFISGGKVDSPYFAINPNILIRPEGRKRVVIFDLDGTLSDPEHRTHHILGEKKDWEAFHRDSAQDAPKTAVAELFKMFVNNSDYEVWIMTGREAYTREATIEWLKEHGLGGYDQLVMRAIGDRTEDQTLKARWVQEFGLDKRIEMVFEDRSRMVAMWRNLGYTCLQVCPGDF